MSRRRCQSRGVSFLSMMVRPRESVMRYRPGSILSRFPSWYRTSIARPLTSIEAPAGRAERDGPEVWPFRPEASPARPPPLPPPPPFPCARAVPATGSVAAGKPVAPVRRRKNVRRVTMIEPRGRAAWFGRARARLSVQPFFIPDAMNPRSGRPDGIQQPLRLINALYPVFAPGRFGAGCLWLPFLPCDVVRAFPESPVAPPFSPGRPDIPIRVLHSASACTIALPNGRQRRPSHHRGSRRRS